MESWSICNNKESLGEQGMFHFPCMLFCLLVLIQFSPAQPHTAVNNQRNMEEEGGCKRCEAAAINGGGGAGVRHLQISTAQAGATKASFVEVCT